MDARGITEEVATKKLRLMNCAKGVGATQPSPNVVTIYDWIEKIPLGGVGR